MASGVKYFHAPAIIWSMRNLANSALRVVRSATAKVVLRRKNTIGGIINKLFGPPRNNEVISDAASTSDTALVTAGYVDANSGGISETEFLTLSLIYN